MVMSVLRHGLAACALAGLLVLTSGPALAQQAAPQGGNPAQPVTPPAAQGTLSTPYLGGPTTYPVVGNMSSQGQGGYGGFGGGGYGGFPFFPYMIDPLTGFMFGSAAITNANAQYYLTIQQARLQMAYANQAAVDTRRKLFDQIVYERAFMAANYNPDVVRSREMEAALKNARNNPRDVEVWSGNSLNSLLAHLVKVQGSGIRGAQVALDEDVLKRINVTGGEGGNIGLLKEGGKLQWPLPMQRPEFTEVEEVLNQLLPEAVQEVKTGNQLKGNVSKDIRAALQLLNDKVNQAVNDMTPSEYVEARRYLAQLNAAFKILTDPNAAAYFNRKYAAQGKTVAELVKYMADNGLRFAPAKQGDEPAYKALQNALASYDENIASLGPPQTPPR